MRPLTDEYVREVVRAAASDILGIAPSPEASDAIDALPLPEDIEASDDLFAWLLSLGDRPPEA